MSQPKKTFGFGWIWWVIFPPYAFYRLLRSPLKWYIKLPFILLALLVTWLAYDMTTAPHRVEQAQAETLVKTYIKSMPEHLTVEKMERMGEASSVVDKKFEPLVYYRVVANEQLYQFGLASNDGKKLVVKHVEQLYPIRMGIEGSEKRLQAEAAIWLREHEKEVGTPKTFISESEDGLTQVIKSDKGTFELKIGNQSVYEVNRIDGKSLLRRTNELVLPTEVTDYLKKNEKKAGTFVRTLGYEIHENGEWYYFRTAKGDFLAEVNHDGSIELKKKR